MTTFREIPIGQRFRLVRGASKTEWVKIEPIRNERGHIRWNAKAVDRDQGANFGHSSKVLLPPYGDTTQANRQQKRYYRLKALVQAAGWQSTAELETAMLDGRVAVPSKPAPTP